MIRQDTVLFIYVDTGDRFAKLRRQRGKTDLENFMMTLTDDRFVKK